MSANPVSTIEELDRRLRGGGPERAGGLRWLVTPESWFELPRAARLCAEAGAEASLEVRDGDRMPLAELPLADYVAVYESIKAWWPDLGPKDRPGLADGTFDALLEELRAELARRSERTLDGDGSVGADARFRLPPPGHELVSGDAAMELMRRLLIVERSPSLRDAALAHAAAPDAAARCAEHAWVRLLLQKALVEEWSPELRAVLHEVYRNPDARDRLLEAEQEALRAVDLADWASWWPRELGLAGSRRRARPFVIPEPEVVADTGDPDVTVLIPSYRHETFIEETLHSVCAQTYPRIGILVADDRSLDATVERAKAIADPRIDVRVNDDNLGLGNSVLAALESIETPYVALLNSDDLFHPERVARCRDVLESDPQCELVATGLALVDAAGKRLTRQNVSQVLDGKDVRTWVDWFVREKPKNAARGDLFRELLRRNFLATSSNIFCRREFLERHAESLRSLKFCLDWQLFLDAARTGALVHLDDELLAYRLHDHNTVWFRDRQRWRYALEVNRVAANAVRAHVAGLEGEEGEGVERALRDVSESLLHNTETDAVGLYLNDLVGGLELERHSDAPGVRAVLESLDRATDEREPTTPERARLQALAARGLAQRDEIDHLTGQCDGLREREAHLRDWLANEQRVLAETRDAYARLEGILESERERLTAEILEREKRIEDGMRERDRLLTEVEALQNEVARSRSERDAFETWLYEERAARRIAAARPPEPAGIDRRLHKWRVKSRLWRRRIAAAGGRAFALAGSRRPVLAVAVSRAARDEVDPLVELLAGGGVEPRVLRWRDAFTDPPLGAFDEVDLFSVHEYRDRDLAFWRARAPQRLDELLASVASAIGGTPDDAARALAAEDAFGFARTVRACRARFVLATSPERNALHACVASSLLDAGWGVRMQHAFARDGLLGWVSSRLATASLVLAGSAQLARALDLDDAIALPGPVASPDVERALPPERPELVSIARVTEDCRWLKLVEAAGVWRSRGGEFVLHLAGGPDRFDFAATAYDERVRGACERIGLRDRVVFHPEATAAERAELLARATMFVAPDFAAFDRPFGIPPGLLEAMALGVPAVVAHHPALAEAVRDGVEGIAVIPDDAGALANALQRVAESADLREKLGGSARARFAECFAPDVLAPALHERLRAAIGGEPGESG